MLSQFRIIRPLFPLIIVLVLNKIMWISKIQNEVSLLLLFDNIPHNCINFFSLNLKLIISVFNFPLKTNYNARGRTDKLKFVNVHILWLIY